LLEIINFIFPALESEEFITGKCGWGAIIAVSDLFNNVVLPGNRIVFNIFFEITCIPEVKGISVGIVIGVSTAVGDWIAETVSFGNGIWRLGSAEWRSLRLHQKGGYHTGNQLRTEFIDKV
jgi:hypothetical protein